MLRAAPVLLLLALPLLAQEPRRVVIENEFVRVIDVTAQPGKTQPHDHKVNRVMVYLDAGEQRTSTEGGRAENIKWKAGQALWSPAVGTHTAEIRGSKPVRIIEVELKKPGAGKDPSKSDLDPVKILPKNYVVEIDNDQVRVVRVKAGPKETLKMHDHPTNRVAVLLTDQDFRITTSEGTVQNPKRKAGEVSWGTPVRHVEENLSDQRFEIIMIDLKL